MKRAHDVNETLERTDKKKVGGFDPPKRCRRGDDPLTSKIAFFDLLPDELILAILAALDDLSALASWSLTSRRHHALANDPVVWRHLCQSRFGSLLHHDFAKFAKCWRWLYRAQARAAASTGADVGAVITRINGEDYIYWGDCRDGRPHGYGLALLLPTRRCETTRSLARLSTEPTDVPIVIDAGYEGQWHNGHRHGHGTFAWPNGNRYVGLWADDVHSGHGMCTYSSGECYRGEWRDGRYNGHGTYVWSDCEHYTGFWVDDRRHGHGVSVYSSGDRHEGEWKDDECHGHGVYMWANGSRYEGRFERDQSNGYGVCVYSSSGDSYMGEWKEDEPNGYGVSTHLDGAQYVGTYKDGKSHGKGILRKPNGTCYQGDWVDGDRHGYGVHTKADGSRYKGQWQHDKKNGDGTWDYSDGSCVQGVWSRQRLVSGKVARHRTGTTACDHDSPCRACTTVSSGAG
ncbi:Morn repeat protein [Pandoravirus inopinatum]|uniref:Morn repeat protein n=1 Tax=Pandoravirus inopinatum TaxID=1605721 RepID=A0A0B5IXI9_9VIRU|nr:Morn repeat protein [Pandoravirus inopinatum]AJF97483.1 Morn repeat protein [Pandoravirus inopinatum]